MDSGLSCLLFLKIMLHLIMLLKIIMLNLWFWRAWAMSLITSRTVAT